MYEHDRLISNCHRNKQIVGSEFRSSERPLKSLSGTAGASADILFDEIEAYGYQVYDPVHAEKPLTRAEAGVMRQALGYADYLCHV